ncbi:MAG: hypothetical protein HAW66_10300 [Shewanella sp.]|nr:hypothetical protein [Shewanella sp.]
MACSIDKGLTLSTEALEQIKNICGEDLVNGSIEFTIDVKAAFLEKKYNVLVYQVGGEVNASVTCLDTFLSSVARKLDTSEQGQTTTLLAKYVIQRVCENHNATVPELVKNAGIPISSISSVSSIPLPELHNTADDYSAPYQLTSLQSQYSRRETLGNMNGGSVSGAFQTIDQSSMDKDEEYTDLTQYRRLEGNSEHSSGPQIRHDEDDDEDMINVDYEYVPLADRDFERLIGRCDKERQAFINAANGHISESEALSRAMALTSP